MAKAKVAEIRPYEMKRFGILNPYGQLWTVNTFDNEADAREHVKDFWKKDQRVRVEKFKVIPVNVCVTAVRP